MDCEFIFADLQNALCQYGRERVKQLLITVSYLTSKGQTDGCVIIKNESHTIIAAQCAVEMQQAMEQVNHFNEEHHFPMLQMGISLHSDEVLAGEIGNVTKAKYGVVGFGVNYCSRIESVTDGAEIVISKEVYRKLGNDDWKNMCVCKGDYELKGIDEKVKVYSLNWKNEYYDCCIDYIY